MARDDATASKVGGAAWWPDGEPAPVDAEGRPLALLAQVNFAELPASMPGYPDAGLLQFFVAREDDFYGASFDGDLGLAQLREQRNFRIVYWPDPQLAATSLPAVPSDRLPMDPTRPRRMRFSAGREPLSQGDYRFDRLLGGNAYGTMEAYAKRHRLDEDSLVDAVWEMHSGGGHKLGGYPAFTQQDPRSGGADELLLQLDSDDAMMWGDVGVANFFIAPDDLARRDFSRVAYNWDCH
ncbi:MAG TPA: hypothetical protein DDZ67_13665 [Xanthomonadaceae bacterium]|nr:hypothetical protein [Xanthomonadaceae bacterium]